MRKDDKRFKDYFDKFKERFKKKAEEYANDKGKADELLKKATQKALRKKGPFEGIWDKLQLLFSLVKDYANGKYREIPYGSIVLIILGILYLVSPIDAILDTIPALGFIDDATILGFIIAQLNSDLEKYKEWKQSQNE